MFGDLFRYAAARLRFRGEMNRRFLAGGLGIEERARRLRHYWSPHHAASRREQIDWMRAVPPGSPLTIIGAGRLHDVAWPELSAHFGAITLVDADPLAMRYWLTAAKQRPETRFEIRDVTGVAERWRDRIMRELPRGNWDEALAWIGAAHLGESPPEPVKTAAAISVNLLGQIPLWWQDSVEEALQRRFGRKRTAGALDEWLAALEPSAGWIVEQHLRSLSGVRFVSILTDVEYLHYRGGPRYSAGKYAPPPALWNDRWVLQGAGVACEVEPALYGFHPDRDGEWARMLPHRLTGRDHWLWHLSPLGTENSEGVLHRVGAYRLELP